MQKLVSKFMSRLNITKGAAIVRTIFFTFFAICSFLTIVCAILFFPKKSSLTDEVVLPSGNYAELKKIPGEKILLTKEQFLKVTPRTFFVSFDKNNVYCLNKVNDLFFYYILKVKSNVGYKISSVETYKTDTLVIKKTKFGREIILVNIILPLLILLLFHLFMLRIQAKSIGYHYVNGRIQEKFIDVWL